jgi:hypothetical protein
MKHPEFLLLPVAMVADYLLTIACARLRVRGHAEHFKTAHYELNPIWQSAVAKKRWFNARHLVLTFVLSSILIACVEQLPPDMQLVRFFAGAMIGVQVPSSGGTSRTLRHSFMCADTRTRSRAPSRCNTTSPFGSRCSSSLRSSSSRP